MIIRLRRLRPSLLHAYLLRGNFYGAIAARAARVPAVVTSKRGLHRPAGAAERIAVAVANRFSDAILGNSPAVLDFYHRVESVPMERMVMIPSGIDTDRFSTANSTIENNLRRELGIDERPVVGAVTTFKEKKGFRTLFESFARVRRTVPGALLVVAGESALEGESARLAAELDITASLRLLGRRSDMPEILGAFDVFVLPSESEGMSNALLEAMAMGLPCVATAVGGNPTVIEDGISGFLVAPGDASGMAIQVRALFDDEARRKNVGSAARLRVVSKFSALSMVSQFEALYTRLCGQGGAQ
jgi:glycosyltransferase involved in cell wall biosynthesis